MAGSCFVICETCNGGCHRYYPNQKEEIKMTPKTPSKISEAVDHFTRKISNEDMYHYEVEYLETIIQAARRLEYAENEADNLRTKLELAREALESLVPPENMFKHLGYDEGCPICGFDPDKIRTFVTKALAAIGEVK